MSGIKACVKCRTFKTFEEFYRDAKLADKKSSECIACNKASRQKYREANREKERIRNRDYGKRRSELIQARVKRWRKANPGKERAKNRMREVQKLNACPPWARKGEARKLIQQFYLHAQWLEDATGLAFHVDHTVPLKNDFVCGLHVPANLMVLEASQNISKSAYWWPEQLPCQRGKGSSHAWWREMKQNEHLCDW